PPSSTLFPYTTLFRSKGAGYDYDQALPTLMAQFYPSGMLGVGLTALMASFMSGMAGNVTAFNTVWTYDLYQTYIRRGAPDSHYLDRKSTRLNSSHRTI